ncbi:MAG: hypothetical protein ACE5IW_10455 [bacterium]
MKNKLFAVAMVVLLYVFFVVAFSMADNQGLVSKVLSDVGLSSASAMPSTSSSPNLESAISSKGSLIDPLPDPIRPRPKPRS